MRFLGYRTAWLWTVSVPVVLYISYTLVGSTTEPRPLATGVVLLTRAIDGETLLLWGRWSIERVTTTVVLILSLGGALVVCAITFLVPRDTWVHKLAGSADVCAHSWSRCEISWDRWVAVVWSQCWGVGTVTTTSSTVVLPCTTIHPCHAVCAVAVDNWVRRWMRMHCGFNWW